MQRLLHSTTTPHKPFPPNRNSPIQIQDINVEQCKISIRKHLLLVDFRHQILQWDGPSAPMASVIISLLHFLVYSDQDSLLSLHLSEQWCKKDEGDAAAPAFETETASISPEMRRGFHFRPPLLQRFAIPPRLVAIGTFSYLL